MLTTNSLPSTPPDPSEPVITDTDAESSSITIRWQPGSGDVTEYEVTYSPSSTTADQPIRVSPQSGGLSTTISGIDAGRTYTVSVVAIVNYDSNGAGIELRESSPAVAVVTTRKSRLVLFPSWCLYILFVWKNY